MAKIKPLEDDNILSFLQQDSLVSTSNDDPLTQSVLIVTLDQLQPDAAGPDGMTLQFHPLVNAASENLLKVLAEDAYHPLCSYHTA